MSWTIKKKKKKRNPKKKETCQVIGKNLDMLALRRNQGHSLVLNCPEAHNQKNNVLNTRDQIKLVFQMYIWKRKNLNSHFLKSEDF